MEERGEDEGGKRESMRRESGEKWVGLGLGGVIYT